MKGLAEIVNVMLIIIVGVSLVSVLWFFLYSTFDSMKVTGDSTLNSSLNTLSSCMRIESLSDNNVYIRNCGKGVITTDGLGAYLDDVPMDFIPEFTNPYSYACSVTPEYGTASVVCPIRAVIVAIENSVYVDSASPASCSDPDPGAYCNRRCDYADNCIGQNSCSFTVSNSNCAGDPCPGLYKNLILNVGCEYALDNSIIGESQVGTMIISDLSGVSLGTHSLSVTSPMASAEILVEAILSPETGLVSLRRLDYE